jgi:hypothetical protein
MQIQFLLTSLLILFRLAVRSKALSCERESERERKK